MQNIFNRIISAFYIINAVLFIFSFSMIDLISASRSELLPVILMFLIGTSMIMYAYGDNVFKKISTDIDLAKINYFILKSIAYLCIVISILFIFNDSIFITSSQNFELLKNPLIIPIALLFEAVIILLYLYQSEKQKLIDID